MSIIEESTATDVFGCRKITVGFYSDNTTPACNPTTFMNFFNETLVDEFKIVSQLSLETKIITDLNTDTSNYVFYLLSVSDISTESRSNIAYKSINTLSSTHIQPRNRLFIILIDCDKMETDDDGELVFSDEDIEDCYNELKQNLEKNLTHPQRGIAPYNLCRLSMDLTKIFLTIEEDSSTVNLSEDQIDQLGERYLKKNSKLASVDKKREIKLVLKNKKIENELKEVGYSDLQSLMVKYFKLLQQKKIVCEHYLVIANNLNPLRGGSIQKIIDGDQIY